MKVNKVPEKNEVDDEDGAEKINEEQVKRIKKSCKKRRLQDHCHGRILEMLG